MNIFKSKLKLVKGTRFVSFLFIGCSILIAAGILFAANIYYNIDTGEIVMEEIQRTTGLIRAVGGAIIGGTATSTLPSGVAFEVATTSDALLSGADQVLRFSGGSSNYYVGFKASTSLTTTTVYTWPATYPGADGRVLQSTTGGELTWLDLGGAGFGDITAVGDCPTGDCFTSGATSTSLWFYDSGFRGKLTPGTLTGNATYTLPDLTGTIALQKAGDLGTGGVLFSDNGLIATSSNFTWDNTNRYFKIGSAGSDGQLWLYSAANPYYLGLAATSTMTTTTTYYWPTDYGTDNYVLTTDGSGNLTWKSASGTGAVVTSGVPQAGQVAFFTDSSTIAGDTGFTWNSSTDVLTLGGGLVANLIEYTNGDLELRTNTSGDILLNPASNIVQLATSTYLRTQAGYEIGRAGTQVLREMVPILGFDLPVQTATTSYVKISKTLENYPFQSAATGTARVHKLVFRYAASTTADIDWRISTTTGQTYSSSTLPQPTSEDLEKGDAYVTTTTIPVDGTDWWLDIKTINVPDTVRIFQVFLAAYDEVQ
ncbi:hypothetical protein AMJ48_00010 [Parcubacteria bacterium DG_74_1]|nr:MAG: hypothetical protein AMJ48_00010 [Parcubacteria bacterium DG_74_1]